MAEKITPEVVDALVEHHRRFLRFLESWVGSRAAAEEVLQAAFLKALERGGQLRDGDSAVAWFYRLLRKALADFYRHRDAERRALERHASGAPAAEPDKALETAICERVNGLIPTLKDDYACTGRGRPSSSASSSHAGRVWSTGASIAPVRPACNTSLPRPSAGVIPKRKGG